MSGIFSIISIGWVQLYSVQLWRLGHWENTHSSEVQGGLWITLKDTHPSLYQHSQQEPQDYSVFQLSEHLLGEFNGSTEQ